MSFDAPPSLKAGNAPGAELRSEQPAAGKPSNEDKGQQVTKAQREREQTAAEIEEEELQLEQSQQLTTSPTPMTAASLSELTTSKTAPPAPVESIQTTPDTVTDTLSESSIGTITAYFAGHGATIPPVPTSSVNVSVGGTLPEGVPLFPLPIDLLSQLPNGNFAYFFWGNNVVIADPETSVVDAIIPDVL
jgi:hypothetical protein